MILAIFLILHLSISIFKPLVKLIDFSITIYAAFTTQDFSLTTFASPDSSKTSSPPTTLPISSFTSMLDLSPTDIYLASLNDVTDAEEILYDLPSSNVPNCFSQATPIKAAVVPEIVFQLLPVGFHTNLLCFWSRCNLPQSLLAGALLYLLFPPVFALWEITLTL